jgi:hypothetical protein
MPILTAIDLCILRRLWRATPPEVRRAHPSIRSCVSLDENGSLIAISKRDGWFAVPCCGSVVLFEKLGDAEVFAVGVLIEREGVAR